MFEDVALGGYVFGGCCDVLVFSSPKVLFNMLAILRFCNSFSMRHVAPIECMLVYVVVGVFVVVWCCCSGGASRCCLVLACWSLGLVFLWRCGCWWVGCFGFGMF